MSKAATSGAAGTDIAKIRTLRSGFLQANSAASGTITPQWVGHVFGRMGQGARTTPDESDFQAPFVWATLSSGGTGMMVSLLPIQESSSGLNAGQNVKLTAKIETWFDNNSLTTAPVQPVAADSVVGNASLLKGSMLAGAALLFSLY